MLTTLRIKNLALVVDLTLELQPGCNVITGETGAGKSILIGALNLLLGERADRTLIRSGCESCCVEAVFEVKRLRAPLPSFLQENGLEPCEDGHLVLKRIFTAAGANRQFVNGSPTTLNILATLGEWLVDIHGPHDHQSLLHPARQLEILDAFGNLSQDRAAFAELVRRHAAIAAEKAALIVDEKTYAQQLDLLRFQTREITEAGLQPGEEAEIEQEHQRAANAAKLLELGQAALGALSESDDSVLTKLGVTGRALQELQRIDPSAASLATAQEQAVAGLRELQGELSHYLDRIELDPARLRELEDRLNLLHSLRRKYGPTLAEVIAFGEEAKKRLASLEQRDAELARLNAELRKLDAELLAAGREISNRRRKIIPRLAKAVAAELGLLGFKQSRFDVSLQSNADAVSSGAAGSSPHAPSSTGFDTVEFQFAPNPGEPPRPLRAIASSGEMARVMLALKTVLAAEDDIPVLVFDEVDANVGGETAQAVGAKMRQIARQHQVLCITHLAPVAAQADAHLVVSKEVKAGRTVTEIALLDRVGRVSELARMLGGPTDAARQHAAALLGDAAAKAKLI
ncbi:MAG: DNA repair protein RecN [Verrucomicrobia bacterium]|nr:DNA repair protein RecN [Verrucomicrobiota bacterium]